MKIAVVSIGSFDTHYSDYHIMRDIIAGLLERGHEVKLIQKQYLDKPQYPQQFEKYLGNKLEVRNIRFEQQAKKNLKGRYFADLHYYCKVCHLLRKNKPDEIFLQSNNTAFFVVFYAKQVIKCPLLYNEQDIFPENAFFANILSERSFLYKLAHRLQKYAYENATALSTISDDMKATMITRYGISEDRIKVIYNWGHEELKVHSEKENVFLKKYPKKKGEFRVLYAGNLGKMQNVELVLKAASLLKEEEDICFYIVGSGVNEIQLKELAREENLSNVNFAEMQAPEEVADLYAAADVNIIPLQKGLIYAALPSKTADCLISGKPIITCVDDDSIFSDLVDYYGFENVGTKQPERLKAAILQVKKQKKEFEGLKFWSDYFMASKNVESHCEYIEKMKSD